MALCCFRFSGGEGATLGRGFVGVRRGGCGVLSYGGGGAGGHTDVRRAQRREGAGRHGGPFRGGTRNVEWPRD